MKKNIITREKLIDNISPSGASKWFNCPASVQAEAPKDKSLNDNPYTREGTKAHAMAERMLSKDFTLFETSDDHAMREAVSAYYKYILNYRAKLGVRSQLNAVLKVEEKIDLKAVLGFGDGTIDAYVYTRKGTECHIFDFKYGMQLVQAENNLQCQLYALGLYHKLAKREPFKSKLKTFNLHIVQPRRNNFSVWQVSVEQLLELKKSVKEKIADALSYNPSYNPSETACKYCLAKDSCPALVNLTQRTLNLNNSQSGFPAVESLSPTYIKRVLDAKEPIELFLKAIPNQAINIIRNGGTIEGYRLSQKQGRRMWAKGAEKELEKLLGDKAFKSSLINVTDADKLLDKSKMQALTERKVSEVLVKSDEDSQLSFKKLDA